jgi:hypothetical protein
MGDPQVMIVVERSSSMMVPAMSDPDTLEIVSGCLSGSSVAYGSYRDRWEAARAIVAGLEGFSDDIRFAVMTYAGFAELCPTLAVTSSASGADFAAIAAALPPSEQACAEMTKAESPMAAAISAAADELETLAPSAPKYILLITRGVPDTCAVPDPQCGGDKAIAAAQTAFASGIKTLVVSLHAEGEIAVSEYVAHAGQGYTVAPYPEDTTEVFCIEQERAAMGGGSIIYTEWRDYAEASYGPPGFVHAETLSYTGEQLSQLQTKLNEIVAGTF